MAVCPACGTENPESAKFCNECGVPLGEAPPALEERKVVTVLFCDLVGFTADSEQADPEDVRSRIRPYHARLRQDIERYGGTVEKFIGDAVMAVFGAPVSHEDDAERAVRAGLSILEAISELNAQDPTLALQVRIGINTGEAVVALGARPEEGEGIVTGDVVNTASRLQGAAPVNGVAVSEATFRATERIFEFEELEPVAVKGKTEPLRLYRPLQSRARFGTDVTRTHATPLVGRELEKGLVVGTFERAVQQRSCQLVTIVGEPGVGKSRLCAELLADVEDRPGLVRWRQGRCLPYGDGIAFWALGEIVKAECGILETDTPEEAAAKLDRALPAESPDFAWLKARLLPLVGAGGEPVSQDETFTAWRRVLESWADERESVLVFEDLHWADEALLSFLEHLAGWAQDVPLLLLCTTRPELYERNPTFGAQAQNAQRINLSPLSEEDTARLIGVLLERAVLPAETQRTLLERAGGNPLYAEEFVRLLSDRSELDEEVDVPDSVQALIAARLDTLSAERKTLLQDAAVMGKVFWAGALVSMGDRDPREVEQALHELARKQLVRPSRASSMEGEAEYGFWHVLVQDVCYAQIPRAARATRHQAAAAWVEGKAGERAEDLADVLAHHYQAALELNRAAGIEDHEEELQAQAVRYLALAGERALSLDVDQAERQLAVALELIPPGDPTRASLVERWAQAAQQQGRLQDARQAFEEAADLYRQQGELRRSRPYPDPPGPRRPPARRSTSRGAARRGTRAARSATGRAGARLRPRLHGRAPLFRRQVRRSGRGSQPGIGARLGARSTRTGVRASLARRPPLPTGRNGRARGRAPVASARARAGAGTGDRRHLWESRRCHRAVRGSTGEPRLEPRSDRLLRTARHHRGRSAGQLRQSESAGGAGTDRAGARRGRADRRPDSDGRRHVLACSARACSCACWPKPAGPSTPPTPSRCSPRLARSACRTSLRSFSPPSLSFCWPRVNASTPTRCCGSSTSSAPAEPTSSPACPPWCVARSPWTTRRSPSG